MLDFTAGKHKIKNSMFTLTYFVFDTRVHLDHIKVYEEFRNQGIGTEIMKTFIEESPKDITLDFFYNRPVNFYKRLGFTIEKCVRDLMGRPTDGRMIYRK